MDMFVEKFEGALYENFNNASTLGGFLQFLSILVALLATYFAYRSAKATRLAAQGQLFSDLITSYSSEEMRRALVEMGKFNLTRKRSEDEFQEKIKEIVKYRNEKSEAGEIDSYRRKVSHFFQKILMLYDNKSLINKTFFQYICIRFSGFTLLYAVVEHFEKEIGKETNGYNRDLFTRLLKLSGRDDVHELQRLRPKENP